MIKQITIISSILFISCISPGHALKNQKFNEPVLLHADDLTFDKEKNIVTATGHVEVYQEKEVLTADQITYNRTLDKMTATGNVVWQRETGDVFFGSYAELQNKMKNGLIREFRGILTDDSKLAANTGKRKNGVETQMDQAVYSPCRVCKETPNKPPIWQIDATTALWDEVNHDITYTDAWLEFFGWPVLYTPYLSHPDPTVKQRSGIVAPVLINTSTDLGFYLGVPYYYVISPDKDITIAPLITTKKGAFVSWDYRQRFSSAVLNIGGSYGWSKKQEHRGSHHEKEVKAWRGHINSGLDWDVNENWRIRGNILRSTDATYLRQFPFYGHVNDSMLKSQGLGEGFYGLSYLRLRSLLYQVQRRHERQRHTPIVAPEGVLSYVSPAQFWNSRFYVDANSLVLSRESGTNVQRLSTTAVWKVPFSTVLGDRYALSLRARGDGYHFNHFSGNRGHRNSEDTRGRFFPQAYLEWEYPWIWINSSNNGNVIVSPMASLVGAPKVGDQAKIPNEDTNAIEPNDEYLLSYSRLLGLDRIDDGSRVNYGLKVDTRMNSWLRGNAFVGQTASFSEPSKIFEGTGFGRKISDIMGRISFTVSDYFDVRYRFRIDHDDFDFLRHELNTNFGVPIFKVNVNYLKLPRSRNNMVGQSNNQLTVGLTSAFTKGWSANASTVQDLGDHAHALAYYVGVTYDDECFTTGLQLNRTYYRDRDVRPGYGFMFILAFKNLAGETLYKMNYKTSLTPGQTEKPAS